MVLMAQILLYYVKHYPGNQIISMKAYWIFMNAEFMTPNELEPKNQEAFKRRYNVVQR